MWCSWRIIYDDLDEEVLDWKELSAVLSPASPLPPSKQKSEQLLDNGSTRGSARGTKRAQEDATGAFCDHGPIFVLY